MVLPCLRGMPLCRRPAAALPPLLLAHSCSALNSCGPSSPPHPPAASISRPPPLPPKTPAAKLNPCPLHAKTGAATSRPRALPAKSLALNSNPLPLRAKGASLTLIPCPLHLENRSKQLFPNHLRHFTENCLKTRRKHEERRELRQLPPIQEQSIRDNSRNSCPSLPHPCPSVVANISQLFVDALFPSWFHRRQSHRNWSRRGHRVRSTAT
jgi:hypothetical protein